MAGLFKKITRRLSRTFYEKEAFLLAIKADYVIYGPGSRNSVFDGQQVFLSIYRDPDGKKRILCADSSVFNGSVYFPNESEDLLPITLYNADTGYQRKFLYITMSDSMGNTTSTKIDIAAYANSVVRDYSKVQSVSSIDQLATVAMAVDEGRAERSAPHPRGLSST